MEAKNFIQHLISNVTVNNSKLLDVLTELTDFEDSLRILEYICDFSELPEIPETSKNYNQSQLTGYSFARDEVRYTYVEERVIKVDPNRIQDIIYDDYYDIPKQSDGVEQKVLYRTRGNCSLKRWLDNK